MHDPLEPVVAEKYPALARDLIAPLLHLLTVARDLCGGDLDKFLVLLAIGMRTAVHPDFAKADQDALLRGAFEIFPSLGINVQGVADSVAMPKETARRKIAEMIELGWLHRQNNRLHVTAAGYLALAPLRQEMERAALKNYRTIEAVAATASEPPASARRAARR